MPRVQMHSKYVLVLYSDLMRGVVLKTLLWIPKGLNNLKKCIKLNCSLCPNGVKLVGNIQYCILFKSVHSDDLQAKISTDISGCFFAFIVNRKVDSRKQGQEGGELHAMKEPQAGLDH